MNILQEARLALDIIKSVFSTTEISPEKVIIFATIIRNQTAKFEIGWEELLRQYEELSNEIFKSSEADLFERTREAIRSGAYL